MRNVTLMILAAAWAVPASATSPSSCPLPKSVTLTGTLHGVRNLPDASTEFALELERLWCEHAIVLGSVPGPLGCTDGDTLTITGALVATGPGREIVLRGRLPAQCTAMPRGPAPE